MKVAALISELMACDPTSDVILQKDGACISYSPLSCVDDHAIYMPNSDYAGDVYSTDWTNIDASMTEKEWNKIMKRKRCVVLAPIN